MNKFFRFILFVVLVATSFGVDAAPIDGSQRRVVRGGMLVAADSTELSTAQPTDSVALKEELLSDTLARTKRQRRAVPMINAAHSAPDTLARDTLPRDRFFTDSMSLSKVCWSAALMPGYGQIYNKQYWKLPILYGSLAAGIALYANENKRYRPLKQEYDQITMQSTERTEYLDNLQGQMIRSNTRRQLYLGATIASYIYFIGDAAMNYSTNDVSNIKRATTLATICPGAGQIYNKQYWKVPFVVGGFAAMIYVVDWNNRGYQRFKKAYVQLNEYDANPEAYPDGSPDEFNGRYTADYMKSLRDSYRRNRDLSIIALAGVYILQIIDAHVDAHFQDYDISDDLSLEIEPLVTTSYSPVKQDNAAMFGFNLGFKF